ncbi:hypothetical protein ACFQVA_20640 [Actinomadura keratinilytica]
MATRLLFGMINSVVEWYRPDGVRQGDGGRPTRRGHSGAGPRSLMRWCGSPSRGCGQRTPARQAIEAVLEVRGLGRRSGHGVSGQLRAASGLRSQMASGAGRAGNVASGASRAGNVASSARPG